MTTFRALIATKGITQAELARRIGRDKARVSEYVCGRRLNMTTRSAEAIASALGVSVADVVNALRQGSRRAHITNGREGDVVHSH